MTQAIHFPHLGIHLKHVGKAISFFGFDIAYYGIIIGIGILVGIAIAVYEAKRTRQNPEDYVDFAIYAIIFAILGARIYYVIFSWDMYKDDLLSIFNIRAGGLAIYGGIIAAVITLFVFAARKGLSPLVMLDTSCLGLVAGQMIGRWGNFFNREAFGEYTDGPFAMQLPIDAVRISDITDRMRNHIEMVGDQRYIQVHPTFLYESLWCMVLLIVLLVWRYKKKFDGEIFCVYLAGYGLGRFWIEGLRTDQLLLPIVHLPVSQLLSGILAVGAIATIYIQRKRSYRNRMRQMHSRQSTHRYREDVRPAREESRPRRESAGVSRTGAQVHREETGADRAGSRPRRDATGVIRTGTQTHRDGAGSVRTGSQARRDGAGTSRTGTQVRRDGTGASRAGSQVRRDGAGTGRTASGRRPEASSRREGAPRKSYLDDTDPDLTYLDD